MKCKECKNENRDGAIYCSKCGCKLPQVQICTNPKCRKPLPFGAGFCPECGTKVIQKIEGANKRNQEATTERIIKDDKSAYMKTYSIQTESSDRGSSFDKKDLWLVVVLLFGFCCVAYAFFSLEYILGLVVIGGIGLICKGLRILWNKLK